MSYFFTFEKDSDKADGDAFVVRKVDAEYAAKQKALAQETERFGNNANLPTWLRILGLVFLFVGVCFVSGVLDSLGEENKNPNAPQTIAIFLGIGIPCLVIALGVMLWNWLRCRSAMRSNTFNDLNERFMKLRAACRENLSVPDSAKEIDVFVNYYRIKNGKRKWVAPSGKNVYINCLMCAYRDDDAICFCDDGAVWRIPVQKILRLETVNKRRAFVGWNKQQPFNKGTYKPYKIRANDAGILSVKPCYALRILDGTEELEILFPAYEYETLSALTGRTAETN